MKTTVEFDPSYAMLTVDLNPGEIIKAEPGAMVLQEGVEMNTGGGGGGLFGGFKRMLGGESFFINTFTAEAGGGRVSLAPSSPGDIRSFDLQPGRNIFIQSGSFLACTGNVQTDSKFQGFRRPSAAKASSSSGPSRPRARIPSSTTPTGLSKRWPWNPARSWWWTQATWWHSPRTWTTPSARWAASAP